MAFKDAVESADVDVPVLSERSVIAEFMKGPVWSDIRAYLELRLVQCRDDLEVLDGEHILERLNNIQGTCAALRELMRLPDLLMTSHESEEKRDERADDRE